MLLNTNTITIIIVTVGSIKKNNDTCIKQNPRKDIIISDTIDSAHEHFSRTQCNKINNFP